MMGALLGLTFAAGLVLAWSTFWEPSEDRDSFNDDEIPTRGLPTWVRPRLAGAGVAVGLIVAAISDWPVAGAAVGIAVTAIPTLVGSSRSQADFAGRTEAVAGWVESLRDTMRGARGIEGALRVTAETAPVALRRPLLRMNQRIAQGVKTEVALCDLADEVDNPVCDMVVGVLVHALARSSAQVPSLLDDISAHAREEAHAHLQVHTSRASARTTLRLSGGAMAGGVTLFLVAFRDYLAPLNTTTGQFILAGALAVMGLALVWTAKLSALPPQRRVLDPRRSFVQSDPVVGR